MTLLATTTDLPPMPFSWLALTSMLLAVGASVAMYVMLVRRWTSRRQWVSLAQWARESGFQLRPARREVLPLPLLELVQSDAQVRYHLCDARTTLVQFETEPLTRVPAATPAGTGADGGTGPIATTVRAAPKWNVLIRHRPAGGPVAGLRPGTQALALMDLLPLSKFASLTLGDRFTVYATDPRAAHALAESQAVALLPPDLGLILFENHFVLDFSSRPFDPLEFGRMIALADQLAQVNLLPGTASMR